MRSSINYLQMKRILTNIFLAGLVFFMVPSCIKDTGNYDYNHGNEVTIRFPTYRYTAFLDSTTRLIPIRRFVNPQDTADFTHEWYLNGKKFAEGTELSFKSDTIGELKFYYYMVDRRSGVRFSPGSHVSITIVSPFELGWGILYEKNNESEIAHVRLQNNRYFDFTNLYRTYNNGEVLGSMPVKMRDYPHQGWNTGRGLMVLQHGGQGPVELNAFSYKKVLAVKDAFTFGAPQNFKPVDMVFGPYADFLANSDGKIYTRSFTPSALPFATPWFSTPVAVPGGVEAGSIWDTWTANANYSLMYDRLNKRMLFANHYVPNERDPGVSILPATTPPSGWPVDYTPLNNLGNWEYIWGGTITDDYHDLDGALILRNPTDNQIYFQTFDVKWIYPADTEFTPTGRKLFPGGAFVQPNSIFTPLKSRNYLVFSGGPGNKSIYYYDVASGTPAKKYIDLESSVTVITASDNGQTFAVGLEDGTFLVFDLSNQTIIDGVSKELHRLTGLGKVVDIIDKGGNMR